MTIDKYLNDLMEHTNHMQEPKKSEWITKIDYIKTYIDILRNDLKDCKIRENKK